MHVFDSLRRWMEKRSNLATALIAAVLVGGLEALGLIDGLRGAASAAPLPVRAALTALFLFAVVAGVCASKVLLDRRRALAAPSFGALPAEPRPLEVDPAALGSSPAERTPVTPLDTKEPADVTTRRLESQLRQLTLLHEVTRSLTMTLEFDELLRRLTELLGRERRFDSFAILLPDEEETGLVVRSTYGFDPHLDPLGLRLPLSDETSAAALQSRGHLKTRADAALPRNRLEGLGWRPGDAQLLCMPMRHKDRVEGVLVFARCAETPFASEEIQLLLNIAGQAALALSNARLFAQTVKLSLTDPLTGLHNRRHLFARLDLEIMRAGRYGSPVSVAMFDIDDFKNLNDTQGHAAGDTVLQEIAKLLQRNVRRVDIVARFGGEEFCVILPAVSKDEAGNAAEKLRRLIAETPFPGEESQPGGKLTVSVGYATLPGDAEDVDSLLDAADAALYASKRAGRNRTTAYRPELRMADPQGRGDLGPDRHRPVQGAGQIPTAHESRSSEGRELKAGP